MAKQSSIIKIEGTIDDLTFYKSKDGYRVRKKTGVSAARIQNDPAFARTRENGQEFAIVARSGKVLRRAIIDLLTEVRDDTLVPRMIRRFSKIRNLDASSPRGERSVQLGLQEEEGKNLLRGFDFNKEAPLDQVLRKEVQLDTETGIMSVEELIPQKHVSYPDGATHVSFRMGFLNIDMDAEASAIHFSEEEVLSIDETSTSFTLTPSAIPEGDGVQVHLMLVEFYQEMNNTMYPLNSGAFNALSVVEVA